MSQALFQGNKRFSDNVRLVGLSAGIPADIPLIDTVRILELKHSIEMERERNLAYTIFQCTRVFQEGGSFLDVAGHLYPKGYAEEVKRKQEEDAQYKASLSILEKLRNVRID